MAIEDNPTESTRVTLAVVNTQLQHLRELLQDYCRRGTEERQDIVVQLKLMNGYTRENRDAIIDFSNRIEALEKWKDGLVRNVLEWMAKGLAAGVGIGLALAGFGKALGVW